VSLKGKEKEGEKRGGYTRPRSCRTSARKKSHCQMLIKEHVPMDRTRKKKMKGSGGKKGKGRKEKLSVAWVVLGGGGVAVRSAGHKRKKGGKKGERGEKKRGWSKPPRSKFSNRRMTVY